MTLDVVNIYKSCQWRIAYDPTLGAEARGRSGRGVTGGGVNTYVTPRAAEDGAGEGRHVVEIIE